MTDRLSAELAAELAANNVKRLIDPRGVPVRFSRLRQMAKSALHYFEGCQGDSSDTPSCKLGRGAHALVLNQPFAVWDAVTETGRARPRNGKDWEDFKKKNAGAEILNGKEHAESKAISDAVRRHPIAADMIYGRRVGPEAQLELEVDWTFLGRRCQSHIDVYRRGTLVADLKTCRDGSPDRFSRAAIWSGYHAQLAFYTEAVELLGHRTPDAFIIAVESARPYAVTVMRLSDRAIEAGRKMCRLWMEELLNCERANEWPAYSESIVDLDIPDDDGFTLLVDGSDVSSEFPPRC